MFDYLLITFAKIGLSLVAVFFVLRWSIVVPYIWLKYDRQILKLKKGLNEFKNKQRGMPMTQERLEGTIRQETITIHEKLEIIETKRKLFIDRVNLILSISSINKS
ncbi:hypothetical protein KKC83_05330 [Patescibacteria group bacterium]|nr:hypothetical protein [Candidatus Falkowbacteria bacterium]MBU3906339.1 hypothetical protein [Patescibacteria group bacterium]MBU4015214.1 hypothetical protein [Patescibacteria group bacterium]MBU4026939.1 hypothetical protein [Patescibacteria group bacterium]MBU4072523.1 hypothetical protein [Patescibacteria group bacterium]